MPWTHTASGKLSLYKKEHMTVQKWFVINFENFKHVLIAAIWLLSVFLA